MSEVVQLNSRKQRELDVWQCRCGSYAFWLYSDGSVTCLDCKQEARTMHGYWRVPAPDADDRMARLGDGPVRRPFFITSSTSGSPGCVSVSTESTSPAMRPSAP